MAKRSKKVEETVPDPDFVDRSNFNCENCGGDGLVKNGFNVDEICPICQGKGHNR